MRQRRFRRQRDGSVNVHLEDFERQLLKNLPEQLRELLEADTPEAASALVRLFPPAYLQDPEHDAEFQRLMRTDLVERKVAVAEMLRETADARSLRDEQLSAWMGAINDLRLVLGTQLDVSEGLDMRDFADDDPRLPALSIYSYLSGLLDDLVDVLLKSLPPDR